MLSLKNHVTNNNGPLGNPKQPRQPIKSWTAKTVKTGDRSRQNGLINSPRGLYSRGKVQGVGGEWALKECEEHTTWLNGILKKHKSRPIVDLRKSISDGLTLVNILEILFNGKINGVQTRPIIRAQRLENINLCLRFLESRGVEIQNISADELTDSNLRATLALVSCLRKRFEAFNTSNASAHGDGSGHSIDKSVRPPTEDSIQPSLGREASIHSFHSQHSLHSQHSDGTLARPKSSEIPATIPSDDDEELPDLPISPVAAAANGNKDLILPGTMADSDPEEPRPESADKPDNVVIPSVTQLDPQGVSQHGVGTRKQQHQQQFAGGHKKSFRPPPPKHQNSSGTPGSPVLSRSPVREALSQSVEERLKSLLDSPNPGRRFNRNQPVDEGELLELPPPRRPSYHDDDGEDDGIEGVTASEESRLQAMLEDPDNFEDYTKDWDRYVSGYVPSHAAEKSEGPRAQRLLDRQTSQPSPPPTTQRRTLPFFHAPPSQHMGPVQGSQPPMDKQSPYMNGSQSGLGNGGMYAENGWRNPQYSGPPMDPRMHHYYPGDESPSQRRKLPSYTDHIQRHPPKQRLANSHNQGVMNSPMRQPNGYPRDWQQPMRRGEQYEQRTDYGQRRDYEQLATDQEHQRMRQHLNQVHGGPSPSHRGGMIPMEDLSRRPDYRFVPGGRQQDQNSPYGYMDHMAAGSRSQQAFLRNGGGLEGLRSFALNSQSDSTSRSSTPPLPPLSPDNSDIDSVPSSPYLGKKTQRSISVGVLPSSFHMPPSKQGETFMGMKKRKGNSTRSVSVANKTFEPKTSSRRSAGKGRRKISAKGVKSNSASNISVNAPAPGKRKSPNNRALPTVPLHKVQEHTENTDSDLSSHRSARPSDSDDEDSASHPASLPSKPAIKITDAHQQQQQQSATESVEPPDADNIRQQLVSLEKMYKEIIQVIGNDRRDRLLESPGDRLSVSSMSTASAKTLNKTKGASAKSNKRREKDIKLVNRRFARVESHVVTLARSVAHLSSELRSQSAMFHEMEALRHEINQIRDMQVLNGNDALNAGGMKFRPIVPLCSSPQKMKKLTKFFGEAPPLLTMFLQELGYEKYASLFEKEGIGMVELPYLSEERLECIGVPTGPRLRILQEAQLMV